MSENSIINRLSTAAIAYRTWRESLRAKTENATETTDQAVIEWFEGGKAEMTFGRLTQRSEVNVVYRAESLPDRFGSDISILTCPTGQGILIARVQTGDHGVNVLSLVFFKESNDLYNRAKAWHMPRLTLGGKHYVQSATLRQFSLSFTPDGAINQIVRFNNDTRAFDAVEGQADILMIKHVFASNRDFTPFKGQVER